MDEEACSAAVLPVFGVSVPPHPAGGYVVLRFVEGLEEPLNVRVTADADTDEAFLDVLLSSGEDASAALFWAAAPGWHYQVTLDREGVSEPDEVMVEAAWHAVADSYAPNTTKDQAAPILLDETVEAYHFAGFTEDRLPRSSAYVDWYSLDLEAGALRIATTGMPRVVPGFSLFNSEGERHLFAATAPGLLKTWVSAPGTYHLEVGATIQRAPGEGGPADVGETVPPHFTQPYRLTPTQNIDEG